MDIRGLWAAPSAIWRPTPFPVTVRFCAVWDLIAQFIYGILPYLLWFGFKDRKLQPDHFLRLNSVKKLLRYIGIIVLDSAVMAVMFGILMRVTGLGKFWTTADVMVFLNNVVFCMILGIPIIVFAGTRSKGRSKPVISLNERLILIFILLGACSRLS